MARCQCDWLIHRRQMMANRPERYSDQSTTDTDSPTLVRHRKRFFGLDTGRLNRIGITDEMDFKAYFSVSASNLSYVRPRHSSVLSGGKAMKILVQVTALTLGLLAIAILPCVLPMRRVPTV